MKAMGVLVTLLALLACSPDADSGRGKLDVPVSVLESNDARVRGRTLFRQKCALCHGERADGKGARSKGLSGKPINFQNPDWRNRTSPADVFKVLDQGKRGTSMPAWPTLTPDQKWDIIAYVLSVAENGP